MVLLKLKKSYYVEAQCGIYAAWTSCKEQLTIKGTVCLGKLPRVSETNLATN